MAKTVTKPAAKPVKKKVEPMEIERRYAVGLFKAMSVKGAAKQTNDWMTEQLQNLPNTLSDEDLAELESNKDKVPFQTASTILESLKNKQPVLVIDDEEEEEEEVEEETEEETETEEEEETSDEEEEEAEEESEEEESEEEDEESETEDEEEVEEETEDEETEDSDEEESETEDDEETETESEEESEDEESDEESDDSDETEDDEEEEEVEPAPKKKTVAKPAAKPAPAKKGAKPAPAKAAAPAKKAAPKAPKGPGVIQTIIKCLLSAKKTAPIRKSTILKELVKVFGKSRPEKAMQATLNAQVPTGLKTEKGIIVQAVKMKDDSTGYYISSMGGYTLPKAK